MAWRLARSIPLLVFILTAVLAIAVIYFDSNASLSSGDVVAKNMNITSGGQVVRIDRMSSRPSYWKLLPFNPPFWPVVSLLIAVPCMWGTRNIIDRYRYWIRSVMLGLIFAPLPVPGGAHVPDFGVVPAAGFLITGIGSLFVAFFHPAALVGFVWSIPGIIVTFLSIFLTKGVLEFFDDGNPLSNKIYFGMLVAGIFTIACVYHVLPRLYEMSVQNSPPPPPVMPVVRHHNAARGVVTPVENHPVDKEDRGPDEPEE